MPDPRLQEAAEEIKATCKKYDCAAMVTLISPSHAEYLRIFDPSWSCAWIERGAEGFQVRIKAKQAEFPNREAWTKAIADTVGMVIAFIQTSEENVEQFKGLLALIAKHVPAIDNFMQHDGGEPLSME